MRQTERDPRSATRAVCYVLPMVKGDYATSLLEMRGITKAFSGVRALKGVDLDVRPGEVHCILGQNGAGKSTLIKILAGAYQPDGGEIIWQGEPVTHHPPGRGARPRHRHDVPGARRRRRPLASPRTSSSATNSRPPACCTAAPPTRRPASCSRRLGHGDLNPNREVGTLSAANKQIVSMARALSHDIKLIIMDEPSAVLDSEEVKNLFRVVSDLTAEGIAVVYISHRLEEIRQIGDRITVLKDGASMASGLEVADTPTTDIIRLMTGRVVENVFPARPGVPADAPAVLEVAGLGIKGLFTDIDFTVRAGEIVGLAGLVGSGRSEILETIYGARKASSGTVTVRGKTLRNGSVRHAVNAGLGLSPEERKSQGLLLEEPVFKNVTLASFARFARFSVLNERKERAVVARADRGARAAAGRPRSRDRNPLRRQPAEDPARPLARRGHERAAARRADPRRRRRRPLRDLLPHPTPRRRRNGDRRRLERDRGGARPRRQRPRRSPKASCS